MHACTPSCSCRHLLTAHSWKFARVSLFNNYLCTHHVNEYRAKEQLIYYIYSAPHFHSLEHYEICLWVSPWPFKRGADEKNTQIVLSCTCLKMKLLYLQFTSKSACGPWLWVLCKHDIQRFKVCSACQVLTLKIWMKSLVTCMILAWVDESWNARSITPFLSDCV